MAPSVQLTKQARSFAGELSELLNTTICHGIRLNSVIGGKDHVVVGYNITKLDQDPLEGIPVTLSERSPDVYLNLSYRLSLDHQHEYLMVASSFMGLYLGSDLTASTPLLHYDYERNKPDNYPEAHLQVHAASDDWAQLCERTRGERALGRLHLPVGGRRYRPTLEDLIEFVIVEKFAEARPGALEKIAEGRERFQKLQLRAAVRRLPESAFEVLRDMGLATHTGVPFPAGKSDD